MKTQKEIEEHIKFLENLLIPNPQDRCWVSLNKIIEERIETLEWVLAK